MWHEGRGGEGGGGTGYIGEKMTVRARQHVWVRTPSVRMASFSDVKRRSDARSIWICTPNPVAHKKDRCGPTCKGLYKKRGRKLDMRGTVCVFA